MLERITNWRSIAPDIAIRSTFVVGFPGETEEDFQYLLDWLDEAQLDRVGAFRFEPVEGAAANALPDPVPEEVKEERYAAHHGEDGARSRPPSSRPRSAARSTSSSTRSTVKAATGRSKADAPEIDGEVHLRDAGHLQPGDIVSVEVEDADEHDLFGVPLAA